MKEKRKLFHHMLLFDGVSDVLLKDRIIVTSGERIEHVDDIGARGRYGDCEQIDLSGKTLLPGLIDAHLHITVPFIMEKTLPGLLQMNRQVAKNFASCVKYGVTTVRDVGAFPKKILNWRNRIERGAAIGPRILSSLSFITSPKGVPEMAPRLNPIEALIAGGQFVERIRTPQEATAVANRLVDMGADLLKTQYTANSFVFHGKLPNLSDACYKAIVEVGRKRGKKVAMHHFEREGFAKGVAAGVDTLEHCATDELRDSDIDGFVAKKMAIVPTLKVLHDFFEVEEILAFLETRGKEDLLSEPLRQSINGVALLLKEPYPPADYFKRHYPDRDFFRRSYPIALKNVERIRKAGGTIGVGTDTCGTGLSFFGSYWKELRALVEAGFSTAEAIKAATVVNSKIIGMADRVGSVEPGKYADFVVVDGDPLADISALKAVSMVVKGGEVVLNPDRPQA